MKIMALTVGAASGCIALALGVGGLANASVDDKSQPVEKLPEITYSQYAESFSETAKCIETASKAPAMASVDTTEPWRVSPQKNQTRVLAGTDRQITDCILKKMMSAGIAGDQHWWGPGKKKDIDMGDCPKPTAQEDPFLLCIEHYHGSTLNVIPVSSGRTADEAAKNLDRAQQRHQASR